MTGALSEFVGCFGALVRLLEASWAILWGSWTSWAPPGRVFGGLERLLDRDSKKFGVDSKKFEVDSKKFGVDSKQFAVDSKKFAVDSKKFGVDSKKFGVDSKKFGVDSKKY
jgi:hypothetical protein